MKRIAQRRRTDGFTIVELAVVIGVLGILAAITVAGFGSWQASVAKKNVSSDLTQAAASFENEKNFNNAYPSTFPANFKSSPNVVLESTSTAAGKYCINGYHTKYPNIRLSISSDQEGVIREYQCTGATLATVGGTIPASPTGTNIAPALSSWTLSGTASYNSSTKELTLGTNGTATSPLIRVNGVAGMSLDGQFYATVQSAQATLQPYGGWHSGSRYYASDGSTLVANTGGYTANGCARQVTLGTWGASRNGACTYALGPNVIYVVITLYSSTSGYASTDLKVKDPSIILN